MVRTEISYTYFSMAAGVTKTSILPVLVPGEEAVQTICGADAQQ
jgi:hypothetical protein